MNDAIKHSNLNHSIYNCSSSSTPHTETFCEIPQFFPLVSVFVLVAF